MTLRDFFEVCAQHPSIPMYYFIAVPATALLSGFFSKGETHLPQWRYLFAGLIYLAFVPGLFAITFNIYQFLFERQSIMEASLILQVLPVVSMLVTWWIITRFISLKNVPGFGHLSGLVMMIFALLAILWFLERTHIWVVTYLPFTTFVLILVGMLIIFRWGWKRLFE